ncbi:MAG: hypothetical protein AB7P69_17745 [Candidatus Binatia bacterium]
MAVNYNEPITFGSQGAAKSLSSSGIDFSESGLQSWTIAPVAEIDLAFPFSRNDITMELEAIPFIVPETVPVQKAFIFAAGSFVGFLSITGHTTCTFSITRSMLSGRTVRLSIVIPTAVSPSSIYMSDDQRELGLRLASIAFRTGA